MRTLLLATLLAATASITLPIVANAQPPDRRERQARQERLRERIHDLRKVKLLDLLDLEGDQVEKFFAIYNRFEDKIEEAKEGIDEAARELQGAIGNDASEGELGRLTNALRDKIRAMERLIEQRFDDSKAVLTARQYAQYVVFEARFRDELQRMILDRMRRMRDRR